MTTMRAARWRGTDEISVEDVELPTVPQGWSLVEVAYNGICGSDLSILHGKHPRAQHGLIPGHELAGWVVEQGDGGPGVGALVVAEPLISCGACGACRSGNAHVCRRLGLYGIDAPGALARYVALPPQVLHEVPEHVSPTVAALVEPLAVAVHAVALSGLRSGDTVAVAGAGPIGVLTALVARQAGAGRVIVSEPSQWRREVAARYGFEVVPEGATLTETVLAATDGEGADVFFDSAGHPAVAPELTTATRVLGTIVIVGVHKAPAPIDLRDICFKEQVLRGVRVYTRSDVQRAVELVASDELDLASFPVRIFDLEDTADAFQTAASGADCLKVLVTPGTRTG